MRMVAMGVMVVAAAGWAQDLGVGRTPVVEEPVRRFEVSLAPAAVQVNGGYTEHAGTFGSVTWYPHQRIGFQVLGGGNWHTAPGSFVREMTEFGQDAVAKSMLMTWGAFGGVEFEPLVGEFSLFGSSRVRFGLVVGAAVGAGGTRHQLRSSSADTGVRFMGTFSAGVRAQVADRVTIRLGLRDILYSSKVTAVGGCSDTVNPLGAPLDAVSTCRHGVAGTDIPFAIALIKEPNAELLQNLQLSLGIGVLF
ncbi:MAG TPA: hypothetical protein VGD87_10090 [Archangium sp.]